MQCGAVAARLRGEAAHGTRAIDASQGRASRCKPATMCTACAAHASGTSACAAAARPPLSQSTHPAARHADGSLCHLPQVRTHTLMSCIGSS